MTRCLVAGRAEKTYVSLSAAVTSFQNGTEHFAGSVWPKNPEAKLTCFESGQSGFKTWSSKTSTERRVSSETVEFDSSQEMNTRISPMEIVVYT